MTHSCTDVYYHSRHTAFVLFLFIFSYLYSLYQCYLFCCPLFERRKKKPTIFSIDGPEIFQSLFFTLSFTMTIAIDYYLIRPSFGVCLMVFLYYFFERFTSKFNIMMILAFDILGILFVFYLQDGCFVKSLVLLRILLEGIKLICTYFSNDLLKIHKSGGVHIVGCCILCCWIVFFLLKRS